MMKLIFFITAAMLFFAATNASAESFEGKSRPDLEISNPIKSSTVVFGGDLSG